MDYSQQEFLDLLNRVDALGGVALDRDHLPHTFRMKRTPRSAERTYTTAACGQPALFDIPYPLADDGPTVTEGTVRVCAVCDNVGMWPRFQGDEHDDFR